MGPSEQDDTPYVSTGRLPSPEEVRRCVDEAYGRYRTETAVGRLGLTLFASEPAT